MHEHTTCHPRSEQAQTVHPSIEALDSQGMGAYRKRDRSIGEASDSSPNSLAMAQGAGARDQEVERGFGPADSGADAVKKRDELGLANHPKGATFTQEQRHRIVQEVQKGSMRKVSLRALF